MKNCRNCIWHDQCGSDCACEYYEEFNAEDISSISSTDLEVYENDLHMRYEDYRDVESEYND